ncbi:hypothetical protein ACWEOE_12145 [Amycolatopsis sp. NPDC004368]
MDLGTTSRRPRPRNARARRSAKRRAAEARAWAKWGSVIGPRKPEPHAIPFRLTSTSKWTVR